MVQVSSCGSKFQGLDYGTRTSAVDTEEIRVVVQPEIILNGWAEAYARELARLNPIKYGTKATHVSGNELTAYFNTLLYFRIRQINDERIDCWRQLKSMAIPSWVEYMLTCVGIVYIRDYGLKIVPEMGETKPLSMSEMLEISEKLRMYENDGLVLHIDAMPRSREGDADVMSYTIAGQFIMGMKICQPLSSYMAAFLGLKIQEDKFMNLYRVRYDDLEFIKDQITYDQSLRK